MLSILKDHNPTGLYSFTGETFLSRFRAFLLVDCQVVMYLYLYLYMYMYMYMYTAKRVLTIDYISLGVQFRGWFLFSSGEELNTESLLE